MNEEDPERDCATQEEEEEEEEERRRRRRRRMHPIPDSFRIAGRTHFVIAGAIGEGHQTKRKEKFMKLLI